MTRLFAIAGALLVMGAALIAENGRAVGQYFNPPMWFPKSVVGCNGPYKGPADKVSGISGWWGLRAMSCSQATGSQKAINIRRASDNTTKDIFILSSGDLDVATATTFCTSTTCFVKTVYDQSGNGSDATNATNADQPTLVFSCLSTLACMSSGGSPVFLQTSNTIPTPGGALSYSMVAERTGGLTSVGMVIGDGTATAAIGFSSTAGNGRIYRNGSSTDFTMSSSAWHAAQANLNGASSSTNVDGASTALTVSTIGTGAAANLFAVNNVAFFLIGRIAEVGLWDGTGFTSGQQTSLCQNQQAYWGTGNFPATC